ncbi:MAG TPA: UDP-N-acetylmuramoyl-tripeptide--D-alanyl-D-alanine ligase [Cellvibrionaceae bacterium]|nr:UDP-N-acetylmuramoyl-tripeptide--D-alanyl-D-alanine ligase [Cellvibrionaceae bacterium]
MMNLTSWAAAAQGTLVGENRSVSSVCTDSRTLQAGDVFFALKGPNFDGHAYLAQVAAAGAAAAVVEQLDPSLGLPQILVADTVAALGKIASRWRQEHFHGTLFAITGSCGKTTVKGMLKSICEQAGATLATAGNLNNHLGVPLTLMQLRPPHQFAVIEMGASGRGEIAYLTALARPDVALVNNVQPAHVEGFGSLAAIREEKLRIFAGLAENGTLVLNLDDNYVREAYDEIAAYGQNKIGFSLQPSVPAGAPACRLSQALQAHSLPNGAWGFEWASGETHLPIELSVLGKHNIANALAAASMALAAGIAPAAIAAGLALFGGEKGRMQAKIAPTGAILIDDTYNANPGSVAAAIAYLAERPRPRILVLGDMKELGQDARAQHRNIGQLAQAAGVDQLYTVGGLSAAATEAFGPGAEHFPTQAALIAALKPVLNRATSCLIKGSRSARMEHIVEGLLALDATPETQPERD